MVFRDHVRARGHLVADTVETFFRTYMVGERYPFGTDLQSWEVSMGFAFIGFGVLFAGASILAYKAKNKWAWIALLLSWALIMLPHALIAISFMIDDPSLGNLGVSKYAIPFA